MSDDSPKPLNPNPWHYYLENAGGLVGMLQAMGLQRNLFLELSWVIFYFARHYKHANPTKPCDANA